MVYLLLGIIGLPVFAGGKAGLGVLFGPTGGYLIGFVVAAFVIGKLVALKNRPGFAWICLSLAAGTAVIYALGVLQLSLVARLTPLKALTVGVLPFLPGDAVKIVLTALIARKLQDRLGGKSPMIRVEELFYRYDREPPDCPPGRQSDFAEGEHTALIGPNGCGKTTLIKHLNALLFPRQDPFAWMG